MLFKKKLISQLLEVFLDVSLTKLIQRTEMIGYEAKKEDSHYYAIHNSFNFLKRFYLFNLYAAYFTIKQHSIKYIGMSSTGTKSKNSFFLNLL